MRAFRRVLGLVVVGVLFGMVLNWVVFPDEVSAPTTTSTTVKLPETTTTTTTSTTTTTTTTTTVAKVAKGTWRCPEYEQLFVQYGLVPVEVFSYIAYRESRCRKQAVNAKFDNRGNIVWALNKNGSYDSGLLQINSSWKTVTKQVCGGGIELLTNLDCNLRVAKYLLDNGGLSHWIVKD